jgi:hypothetical protein
MRSNNFRDDTELFERAMEREHRRKVKHLTKDEMRHLHDVATHATVGATIQCPTCGKEHKKVTKSKVFCSNYNAKGTANCKDRYWNTVNENKLTKLIGFLK